MLHNAPKEAGHPCWYCDASSEFQLETYEGSSRFVAEALIPRIRMGELADEMTACLVATCSATGEPIPRAQVFSLPSSEPISIKTGKPVGRADYRALLAEVAKRTHACALVLVMRLEPGLVMNVLKAKEAMGQPIDCAPVLAGRGFVVVYLEHRGGKPQAWSAELNADPGLIRFEPCADVQPPDAWRDLLPYRVQN
jgi:hypothetical protein